MPRECKNAMTMQKCLDNAKMPRQCKFKRKNANIKKCANLKGKMQNCHDNANLTGECKFKRKNIKMPRQCKFKRKNANIKGKTQK